MDLHPKNTALFFYNKIYHTGAMLNMDWVLSTSSFQYLYNKYKNNKIK